MAKLITILCILCLSACSGANSETEQAPASEKLDFETEVPMCVIDDDEDC